MAKSKKAAKEAVIFEASVMAAMPDEINGHITSVDDKGIQVQFKRKRAKKSTIQYVPYSDMLSLVVDGNELTEGAAVEVLCKSRVAPIDLGVGELVDSPVPCFVALADEDGNLILVSEEDSQLVSEEPKMARETSDDDDEKPARKPRKPKVEDDDDDDSSDADDDADDEEEEAPKPKKRGRKPRKDEDEDEDETPKSKKPGKSGKKKPARDEDDDDESDDDNDDWD